MADVRAALSRALAAAGAKPTAQTLDTLAAQVSLETAHGSAMFNFNFGGIKGISPRGETTSYTTREVTDGQSVSLPQGFRAYASLDEGARDYVSVLRARFPAAFHQALSGTLDGFAHALKAAGYYTADESEYASGLRAAGGVGSSTQDGAVQSVPTELATSAELSRVIDAVAATAVHIADPDPSE